MPNETLAALRSKYEELEKNYKLERAALEKQIADAQKVHQADAIAKIRAMMEEHGLTPENLTNSAKAARRTSTTKTVPAKYRGPDGQTWTGRGRQPKWLGDDKARFLIKP